MPPEMPPDPQDFPTTGTTARDMILAQQAEMRRQVEQQIQLVRQQTETAGILHNPGFRRVMNDWGDLPVFLTPDGEPLVAQRRVAGRPKPPPKKTKKFTITAKWDKGQGGYMIRVLADGGEVNSFWAANKQEASRIVIEMAHQYNPEHRRIGYEVIHDFRTRHDENTRRGHLTRRDRDNLVGHNDVEDTGEDKFNLNIDEERIEREELERPIKKPATMADQIIDRIALVDDNVF